MEIINIQFLYLSVVNLLMGFYFYLTSQFSKLQAFQTLKKSYIPKIYLLFLFLCLLSFFAAKNITISIAKFTDLVITFCLFVNLTILLKDKHDILYKIIFIVGLSAFLQAGQQLFYFREFEKGVTTVFALSQLKGNTGNINILAASLSIKVPFLILGIFHFSYFKRAIFILAFIIVTVIIILTGARSSLINLFLLFSIYIIYYLKENSFTKSSFIKCLIIIIPILLSIFISNEIFEKSKDEGRYVSVQNRIEQINTKDESINKRLGFWKNAITLTKTSPLLGIGLGNYQVESIPYEKTTADEFNVSLHAHNDFLEILAETGILNGLVYFSLFVFLLIVNLKNILKSKNENTKTTALLVLMVLVVYGVDSLFNFPMYRPTMQLFFALLLALTVLNNLNIENTENFNCKTKNKIIIVFFIVVSMTTTYCAYIICKASNLEYLICTDDINNKLKGVLTGDEVVKRIPQFPNIFGTSESFYEYAGIYYLRENKFDKAFNCFSKGSKINPYTGRIEFYKYVIANKKGNTDSAYVYIKKAFNFRPRNIMLYKTSINLAARKNDTVEILKEHKIITKYINSPEIWNATSIELKRARLSENGLERFIKSGLKEFPKDSTLLKYKSYVSKEVNDALIAQYITEGQNFVDKKDLNQAMKSYQKALKLDPENIYVMQNLGFYYFTQNQYKQALNYFLKALKYPGLNDGKTELMLGFCYLKTNDKANACKYFNTAKNRNYPNAYRFFSDNCK